MTTVTPIHSLGQTLITRAAQNQVVKSKHACLAAPKFS